MSTRARPLPKLVSKAEACDALGICAVTFWRRWDKVFTAARTPGGHRRVYRDELAAAPRGVGAVLAVRAAAGRV